MKVNVWVDDVLVQTQEVVIGTEMDSFSFMLRPEQGDAYDRREIRIQVVKA